ncbi:hypothetical protein [Paraburkholderia ribeironis]|nr:hypothetical protein [Paraburkholderia ribeironis]
MDGNKLKEMSPRLSMSGEFLRDAKRSSLSSMSRLRCGFESAYLVLCEIAVAYGVVLDGLTHPAQQVLEQGMDGLDATDEERACIDALAEWIKADCIGLQPCSADDICDVAEGLLRRYRMKPGGFSIEVASNREP